MKKFLYALIVALSVSLTTGVAFALNLDQAKSQGLVGETPSGYLEAVSNPDANTKKLINSINKARKETYKKIATDRGTDLKAVEKLAGETAMNKTAKGNYIKVNGKWVKK